MALCSPAMAYLGISILFLIIVYIQNVGNVNLYCLGTQSCEVSHINIIFFIKLIYILFWTWILNLICSSGSPSIAWFLVLLPFILMFIMLAMMMIYV
jgi:hypothetical protein